MSWAIGQRCTRIFYRASACCCANVHVKKITCIRSLPQNKQVITNHGLITNRTWASKQANRAEHTEKGWITEETKNLSIFNHSFLYLFYIISANTNRFNFSEPIIAITQAHPSQRPDIQQRYLLGWLRRLTRLATLEGRMWSYVSALTPSSGMVDAWDYLQSPVSTGRQDWKRITMSNNSL